MNEYLAPDLFKYNAYIQNLNDHLLAPFSTNLEINFDLLFDNHTFFEGALLLWGMTAWPRNLEIDMDQYTSFLSPWLTSKNL